MQRDRGPAQDFFREHWKAEWWILPFQLFHPATASPAKLTLGGLWCQLLRYNLHHSLQHTSWRTWSAELKRIFGLTVDSAPPPRIVDLIHPEDRAAARRSCSSLSTATERARCNRRCQLLRIPTVWACSRARSPRHLPSFFSCRL